MSVDVVVEAGSVASADVLRHLEVAETGLTARQVRERLARYGPNAVSSHRAQPLQVLWHQVRSPLLGLLAVTAVISAVLGQATDSGIIAMILTVSIGLGFVNEYRAERAAEALHSQIRQRAVVVRDGRAVEVDATELVPGDLVEIDTGDIVPADLRLVRVSGLDCDESVLTGESLPVEKDVAPVPAGTALADLGGCALMGTVVHAGSGRGVVVATGPATVFGRISTGLGTQQTETEFQVGLRRYSMLLVYVAGALTGAIFLTNVLLDRPVFESLLFSLAIAVGMTPQLLPAVVSTSLATGSRRLAERKVLVKRLVCIEDLGDIDMLFTDKTGTLTQGRISFMRAVPDGTLSPDDVVRLGLLATGSEVVDGRAVGGNPLDTALWESPATAVQRAGSSAGHPLSVVPFDHERRMTSVLVDVGKGDPLLVVKGAPEAVLERCVDVPEAGRRALAAEFAAGNRVVAVATRALPGGLQITPADERDLRYAGLLVFLDPPRPDASAALTRLAGLGISVKIVTGDNATVAAKVCADLGLPGNRVLSGPDVDALDDQALAAAIAGTTVFARVSPEQKARIVQVQRVNGGDVAFLGDGVNDALALHAADVGISVDSATDVAKDAADVILLEKDLAVLADGVAEGRRIFANTIKYVLMGTSSNFGNMFSAAGASLFLGFLPMLPSQVLLNNLLYDASQLAIPTDNVDEAQLRRPSHWDIGFIRRFMLFFGPLSSVFDFATFGVMIWVFHAGASQFRSGWFVESLATQTLIIFVIRTRRSPFLRSRPSLPLTLAALSVVTVGALLPLSPLASPLGFARLPGAYFATLMAMVVAYLLLVDGAKRLFYRRTGPRAVGRTPSVERHQRRRAAKFTSARTGPTAGRRRPRPTLPPGISAVATASTPLSPRRASSPPR